ncbi:hypothetical protein ON010_g16742 [Phytophthora cinnamomi]|nr:hypothetical protein ON010_g16742 [Phytophthora cinnamomi]
MKSLRQPYNRTISEGAKFVCNGDRSPLPEDPAMSARIATRGSYMFKSYKPVLTELYKKLEGVQQVQIFVMDASTPGVVGCRKGAKEEVVTSMMTEHVEISIPPPPNGEKIYQMYNNIRPYVPDEFKDDPIYAKPSEQQREDAKSAKTVRREYHSGLAIAAKENQHRRGKSNTAGVSTTKAHIPKKRNL